MSTSRSSADMIQIRAKLLLFQSIDLWTNKKVEFAIYISFTCPYPIFDAPRIERTFVIKTISTICRRSRDTCLFYFCTIPITNVFTYSMIFTVLFSDYFSRRMGRIWKGIAFHYGFWFSLFYWNFQIWDYMPLFNLNLD